MKQAINQLVIYLTVTSGVWAQNSTAYQIEINQWVAQRDSFLRAPDGPVNLIGVYWLSEGQNTFGTSKDNRFVFPKKAAADRIGSYILENGHTTLQLTGQAPVKLDGRRLGGTTQTASLTPPQTIICGSLLWRLMRSNGRLVIRLWDTESENGKKYRGVERFPIDEQWRIKARFTPAQTRTTLPVTTIFGLTNPKEVAGTIDFEIEKQKFSFQAFRGNPGLFIVFSDKSGESESYPFRFLDTAPPAESGEVTLDFNKATNPNCAFTGHDNCPLPPEQNKLPVRVTAGERKYAVPAE